MKVNYPAHILNEEGTVDGNVEEISICPRCKVATKPIHLNSIIFYDENELDDYYDSYGEAYEDFEIDATIESHLFCNACSHTFLAEYNAIYRCRNDEFDYYTLSTIGIYPNKFIEATYSESLNSLSPSFVKIYNEALSAEASGLNEIAGLGYRKSLEFLVKDYAIKEFPNDEDSIKSMNLSPCIKKYIDDSRIKTLAEKSAWIGNDEAHYVRKQEDRDVSDMKNFIKAAVYFISMILITQDADSMIPK